MIVTPFGNPTLPNISGYYLGIYLGCVLWCTFIVLKDDTSQGLSCTSLATAKKSPAFLSAEFNDKVKSSPFSLAMPMTTFLTLMALYSILLLKIHAHILPCQPCTPGVTTSQSRRPQVAAFD